MIYGRGEQYLWIAVIERAIADAMLAPFVSDRRRPGCMTGSPHRLVIAEAQNWLTCNNPGFKNVCDLAGVSPEWVRKKYKQMRSLGPNYRKTEGIRRQLV